MYAAWIAVLAIETIARWHEYIDTAPYFHPVPNSSFRSG